MASSINGNGITMLPGTVATIRPMGLGNNANVDPRVIGLVPMPTASRPSTLIPLPMQQTSGTIFPVMRGIYNYPTHSLFGPHAAQRPVIPAVINNFFIVTKATPDLNLSQIQGQEQKKEANLGLANQTSEESSVNTYVDQSVNTGEASKKEEAATDAQKTSSDASVAPMPDIPVYVVGANEKGEQTPKLEGVITSDQKQPSADEAKKAPEITEMSVYEPGKAIKELNQEEIKEFQKGLDSASSNNASAPAQEAAPKAPETPAATEQPAPTAEQAKPDTNAAPPAESNNLTEEQILAMKLQMEPAYLKNGESNQQPQQAKA